MEVFQICSVLQGGHLPSVLVLYNAAFEQILVTDTTRRHWPP